MNDNPENPGPTIEGPPPAARVVAAPSSDMPFFDRTDWSSFWLTSGLALAVYLSTLAPEVTLEFSGISATAAKYAGVEHPPGFPIWTLYAWLFARILPFSNIAWRVAVSSAVAGALACGVVALMASRGGTFILAGTERFSQIEPQAGRWLRVVSGTVAGMALGLEGSFWGRTVIVDDWALGLFLLALMLSLLMRWVHAPERRPYLYVAALVYGLAITTNQGLTVAVLGLEIVVLLEDPPLGRDLLFATALVAVACLIGHGLLLTGTWATVGSIKGGAWVRFLHATSLLLAGAGAGFARIDGIWWAYLAVGIIALATSIVLILKTRGLIANWRAALATGSMLTLGLSVYFYEPIASMTNPPVNWGYARTVEGFFHLVSRAQYEKTQPTDSWVRFGDQVQMYGRNAIKDFGLVHLLLALAPFWFLRRMQTLQRRWIIGLASLYLCLSLFSLVILNPARDYHKAPDYDFIMIYSVPAHLVLAVLAGYGAMLTGLALLKPGSAP